MSSLADGAELRMKCALNCGPCFGWLIQSPVAVIHSPAAAVAAWRVGVIGSRGPLASTRRTQNPFSALWNVTCSIRPARTSCLGGSGDCFRRT